MYFKFFVKGNYLHCAKSHLISIFIMIFVLVRYKKMYISLAQKMSLQY